MLTEKVIISVYCSQRIFYNQVVRIIVESLKSYVALTILFTKNEKYAYKSLWVAAKNVRIIIAESLSHSQMTWIQFTTNLFYYVTSVKCLSL